MYTTVRVSFLAKVKEGSLKLMDVAFGTRAADREADAASRGVTLAERTC